MCDCITYEEITTHRTCCDLDLCCPQEVIENKICLAVSIIENLTGSTICPYEECKKFPCCNKNSTIYFTPVTSHKLIEVTSVKHFLNNGQRTLDICGVATTDGTVEGTELTDYTNLCNRLQLPCDTCCPCSYIEVCGTWGSYITIPENIKEAIRLLALEYIQPGVTGLNTTGGAVDKVEWEDFRIDYNNSQINDTSSTTGFFEIDRMISNIPSADQIKFAVLGGCKTDCCNNDGCGPC